MPSCPVCAAPVDLEKTSALPFCSERCRLVDLGRWLDESYGVPAVRRHDDDGSGDDGDPDDSD